ncbi:MAG: hypothetical protein AAF799_38835 [Myxococcota bacterium]
MLDAIEELKIRARLLHRRARNGDEQALQRIGKLPEFAKQEPISAEIQLKHGLAVLAREFGFSGWPHARRVLEGQPDESDLGTMLYPRGCFAFTNHWFARYEEAREVREQTGGYLLAYRTQFFVVTRTYVETMGLDPDDPDWSAIGWDWARPARPRARARLYAKLVAARAPEAA